MAQSKRKFYKTVITVEVLSEEEFNYEDLYGIHLAITDGECSGTFDTTEVATLSAKQAVKALKKQGSDPEFFQLTEEGEDA